MFAFLFLAQVCAVENVHAQEEQTYDEIILTLNVQRIGNVDVPAVIFGESAFLSVKDVFDFLKIRNVVSADVDSISGFIINQQSHFVISHYTHSILYQNKSYKLKNTDIIKTENNLFLKTDVFGDVFGLECKFDFRSLSVMMKTKIELPAMLEMQQQQMRQNISQLKGERKADTVIAKKLPMFAIGMADWSVFATQGANGTSNARINLNLGAMIAGGEANAFLNYSTNSPLGKAQQFYRWRYVDNDKKIVKQVVLGNVYAQSTATIEGAVNGVQVTNTPTIYKKSFGNYTISNKTEPEWTVELYINNVLVNYVKADASGFYSFEVPVVYGNSLVKLRHISPWGEERIQEEFINIPYNFVPAKQVEYMVTMGVVNDAQKSKFTRMNVSYGLNNRVTIGGGIEYLSTLKEDKMPFINASVRVGSNIVVSGEHAYKVRSKGVLTYKLPSNLQFEATYIKYDPYQAAIRTNFLEERRAVLSFPFRTKKFSSFYRLTYNEVILPKSKITNAEFLVSGMYKGISTNFTTSGVYSTSVQPEIFSNLSVTFRLPKGFRLSPQVRYEYSAAEINMVKMEIEKNAFKNGLINLSYEKFFASNNDVVNLGLRYNFSAAQTMFGIRQANNVTTVNQSARGSLIYAGKETGLGFSSQNAVGRGGLHLKPFLDLNSNGKRDAGEPAAKGLKFNIRGGTVKHNLRDTSITISSLEAYANYFIQLDKGSFDNIAWQLKHPSISITVEPNHFKEIQIPVSVVAEISGMVYLEENNTRKGQGRIIINVYGKNMKLAARIVSEPDGYFNFIGLAPGSYIANIDLPQLTKLKMKATEVAFTVKSNKEGDIISNLDFVLSARQ